MDKRLFEQYLRPLRPLPTGQRSGGGLKPPLACLFCDLYGTLFISGSGDISTAGLKPGVSTALSDLIDEYGLSDTARHLCERLRTAVLKAHDKAHQRGVGYPEIQIDKIWQTILPFSNALRIRQFATAFELIVNPVWPMPHAHALIRTCRRAGIKLGIISNAQFFTLDLFPWFFHHSAAQLGFDPKLTFCSFQHGEAKPSMKLFNLALGQLERMEIEPQQVAYIGNDLRNDILPARQAGFQTILFAGDRRSLRLRPGDPACATLRADLVVNNLKQLISWLTDQRKHLNKNLGSVRP